MTSQITKDFQMKSKLRKLADGGSPNPSMLGTGAAARAGSLLAGRGRQIDAAADAATGATAPAPAPAPKQDAKAPKKSGLRSMLGLADGGTPFGSRGLNELRAMIPQMEAMGFRQQPAQPDPTGLRAVMPRVKAMGYADGGSLRPEDITGGTATSIFTPSEMEQFNAMGSAALASGNAEAAQAVGAGRAAAAQAAAAAAKEAAQFRGFADGGSYLDDGYNANRYQQSQLRDGGRVKGPGGRTDDKVGPVMLSDEEYVLPGDTADAIGRGKLDAIRLATHEFKDERKESALRGRMGDVPVDHLADGGSPWIADAAGNVRKPNAFGDAAAGPGYQQPRLPPPQPGTAVGPSAVSPGGPRTINMGMVDGVTPRPAKIANNPTAPAAPQAAAGTAPAAASRAEQLGRMAGKATRIGLRAGGGMVATAPLAGFGDYKADTGGVDTSAPGTLGYLAKGEFGNVGTSLSGGAAEFLADSGRGVAKTADWAAGLVGANPNLTGKYDSMISDKLGGYLSLRNPEVAGPPESAASAPDAPVTVTSSPRSDQGPAQMVAPGSYQSRRLSEAGVPLDVQNSNPLSGDLSGPKTGGFSPVTQGRLATQGTDQYQNLGTYGGDANIYGKADDPSRPGRINNFVGVGAGAAPSNEYNGSGFNGGASGALQSALRGLGSGSSAPGGNSAPVDNSAAINARYDKLAKQLSGMYGPKGQGNLARRLLELESSRSSALDADARNATSRSNAAMQNSTLRGNAELNARVQMADVQSRMEQNRANISSRAREAQRKAVEDARKIGEERDAESVKAYESVADSFAGGDKEKGQRFREILSTLGPELDQLAQGLTPTDKRAFYTNILRQQIGRDEGLVLGRDVGATAQNAAIGGLIGRMSRFGDGAAGKAVDTALGKIPRIGPAVSALRPMENLTRFGTILGAGAGAMATPEVEEYNRFDPIARDPVSGAALPARKDLREAFTHGAFDTYLNPFNDVQTVSGRRTNRPNPTEEEAARRYRATLRTE